MLEDFVGELSVFAILLLCYLIYIHSRNNSDNNIDKEVKEKLDNLRDKIVERDGVDLRSIEKAKELGKMEIDNLTKELKDLKLLVDDEREKRSTAYGGIKDVINDLKQSTKETNVSVVKLSSAMKNNAERGEWGEVQLENVITISGMAHRVDYEKQKPFKTKDGKKFRADAIVKMPGGRGIIIDAKAPNILSDSKAPNQLTLEGIYNEEDPKRQKKAIEKYTDALSNIIKELSKKKYNNIIDENSGLNLSPDFVVLFLPGENMLQIALKEDPTIWEKAAKNKVVLASPYILLALLKSIFMLWRDREREDNVNVILSVSDEVVERVEILMKHLNDSQIGIEQAINYWNKAVNSYGTRLQKTRRRLKELKEDNEILTSIEKIEKTPENFE